MKQRITKKRRSTLLYFGVRAMLGALLAILCLEIPSYAQLAPTGKGCLTKPYTGEPVPNAGTTGIVPPRPRSRHTASYPELARRASMEGNVVVAFVINEDGDVTDVRLKRSSGFPLLDTAACSAVWGYRYSPATRDGVITPVRAAVQLEFRLRDQPETQRRISWQIIAAILAGILFGTLSVVYHLRQRRKVAPSRVKVSQIPEVVRQLQSARVESSFVVFMFDPNGGAPNGDTSVNLQYSIEQGRLGLDWVLLSPANIADKADIVDFANQHQHQFVEREQNGVHYLRIEDGGIAAFGMQVVNEFYHRDIDSDLGLISEGANLKM